MRPCIGHAATTYAPRTAKAVGRSAARLVLQSARIRARSYASFASSSTIPHPAEKQPTRVSERVSRSLTSSRLGYAPTLTALHTVRGQLPRIFAPDSPEFEFWDKALADASTELSYIPPGEESLATIVVYSVDQQGSGAALVHALLEDPFASDEARTRVSKRWEGKDDLTWLDICNGPAPVPSVVHPRSPEDEPHTPPPPTREVYLDSSFFSSLPVPLRLSELRPSLHTPSPDTLHALYSANVPIVVANPLSNPLSSVFPTIDGHKSTLFPYPLPPHALLAIISPSPASAAESMRDHLSNTIGIPASNILFVDPFRAKSASHAFRSGSSSALAVQRYHDDTLGSGLSALRAALSTRLTNDSPNPVEHLHAQKATALLKTAIGMMQRELSRAESEIQIAARVAYELRQTAIKSRAQADSAILGAEAVAVNTGREAALSGHVVREDERSDRVREALMEADRIVRPVVERLWPRVLPSWELQTRSNAAGYRNALYRLRSIGKSLIPRVSLTALGSADDVAWMVGQAVQNAWVGGVERTLLPALSPLRPLQERLAIDTLARVASLPPALRSSVLHNSLQQLAGSPSFPVIPSAILATLAARLRRLDEGPTATLGRAAQSLAVRSAGSVGAGAGVTAGWLGWIHGADLLTGAGFTAVSGDIGTAVGAGLLVFVGGFRWAIRRWEKARRNWLADWQRMTEGAERDIKASLNEAMDKQVLAVPLRASEGVDALLARRRDEVDMLKKEVHRVESASSCVTPETR